MSEGEWGSQGNRFAEIENFNLYEKLFTHLQGLVAYPGALAMRGLSDTVNSRLSFDENSHCDWNKSRVGGSNPYFRIYSLALLKKLCAMEAVERLRFKKGQFVDISFAFVIAEQALPENERPLDDFIQGNVLNFRRIFIRPTIQYHAGPIDGFIFIPVASINFPWIYEHWEQWVNGKDPLREFKAN